ncbi:MAG TPA: hypothetical protein DIT48_12060, partial [Actinobacteria bacterium]|nr:hypothetical protein [Actinomycetota bacterium]
MERQALRDARGTSITSREEPLTSVSTNLPAARTGLERRALSGSDAVAMVARASSVDAVGLEERAASLAKRSIKKDAKLWAL